MKEQTYLSKIEDANGRMIDFERWDCKRASTVKKNLSKLYSYSIYRRDLEAGVVVRCYDTKGRVDQGPVVWELPTSFFLANS